MGIKSYLLICCIPLSLQWVVCALQAGGKAFYFWRYLEIKGPIYLQFLCYCRTGFLPWRKLQPGCFALRWFVLCRSEFKVQHASTDTISSVYTTLKPQLTLILRSCVRSPRCWQWRLVWRFIWENAVKSLLLLFSAFCKTVPFVIAPSVGSLLTFSHPSFP